MFNKLVRMMIGGGIKASFSKTHRGNICEACDTKFLLRPKKIGRRIRRDNDGNPIMEAYCPNCGGNKGKLISVSKTRGRWYLYFFGNIEEKRVAYCEAHRNDPIPMEFRAGRLLPTLIFALKLKRRGEW